MKIRKKEEKMRFETERGRESRQYEKERKSKDREERRGRRNEKEVTCKQKRGIGKTEIRKKEE